LFTIVNVNPLILTVDDFISKEQCQNILNFDWKWNRSKGWDSANKSTHFTDIRTSSTVFIDLKNTNIPIELRVLKYKLSDSFNINTTRFEDPQLTKYEPNQFYKDHWDFFLEKELEDNNRVITAILYLTDDFIGGNTTFPILNKSVSAKAGKLLYFQYDYEYDPNIKYLTKHSGDVITSGVKQIVTFWVRKIKWPP